MRQTPANGTGSLRSTKVIAAQVILNVTLLQARTAEIMNHGLHGEHG